MKIVQRTPHAFGRRGINGFSLLEVIVAMGIGTVLSLGILTVLQYANIQSTKMMRTLDYQALVTDIRFILNDVTLCPSRVKFGKLEKNEEISIGMTDEIKVAKDVVLPTYGVQITSLFLASSELVTEIEMHKDGQIAWTRRDGIMVQIVPDPKAKPSRPLPNGPIIFRNYDYLVDVEMHYKSRDQKFIPLKPIRLGRMSIRKRIKMDPTEETVTCHAYSAYNGSQKAAESGEIELKGIPYAKLSDRKLLSNSDKGSSNVSSLTPSSSNSGADLFSENPVVEKPSFSAHQEETTPEFSQIAPTATSSSQVGSSQPKEQSPVLTNCKFDKMFDRKENEGKIFDGDRVLVHIPNQLTKEYTCMNGSFFYRERPTRATDPETNRMNYPIVISNFPEEIVRTPSSSLENSKNEKEKRCVVNSNLTEKGNLNSIAEGETIWMPGRNCEEKLMICFDGSLVFDTKNPPRKQNPCR